jgi:antitoxin PrlF
MPTSTLTSKGQITLPKEIRTLLKLKQGQEIDFQVRAEGEVVLRPKNRDVRRLKGLLARKSAKPVSVREMNQTIADAYSEL